MSDWLAELRQEKEQAIARVRSQADGASLLGPEERLQSDQAAILRTLQTVAIEPALQQFADEVLRDHPLFINPAFMRSVISRSVDEQTVKEHKESAPLSGPLQGNLLPAQLALGSARFVYRVEWRLHLNYRFLNSAQLQLNDILIAVNTHGVQFNSQPLAEPSADAFKSALVNIFRETTAPDQSRGIRRGHRKRRQWYDRLWHSVFPTNRPTRLYAALIVAGMLLLVLLIAQVAANSGG